ncbi:hypothetical protein EDB87DRAFT_1631976 [Lactarius vividus]|nr:hypothetical protein EDB87DRAFT_1631976 [Lactarius vividus]
MALCGTLHYAFLLLLLARLLSPCNSLLTIEHLPELHKYSPASKVTCRLFIPICMASKCWRMSCTCCASWPCCTTGRLGMR